MSEIVHVIGDLEGLGAGLAAWRESTIDKKEVGKLTRHLGPLQGPLTVEEALAAVTQVAGAAARVEIDEVSGTVKIRAVIDDHAQHDLAAPLIGAFRRAGASGGRGALWLVEGMTDAPGFGHVLDVDASRPLVRALGKKELKEVLGLPGRAECVAIEERLASGEIATTPPVGEGGPAALTEVALAERPAYLAAWALVDAADDAALLRAIERESSWFHPEDSLDGDLQKLAALPSKAERLSYLGAIDRGTRRGHLDVLFRLVVWLDVSRGTAILAQAREAGVWPGILAHAMRALIESKDPAAEAEAWALFEASAERKDCDLNHWWFRAGGPYAIGHSSTPTAELVSRLDAALKKKTQLAAQKRIEGYCLALAYRTGDAAAQSAIDRAVALLPEKAKACVAAYAQRNGWKPQASGP